MKTFEKNYLFLVVLGGRAHKANVELHDVRWVVGSKIEETYDILRSDWFGSVEGLHIDSYKKIKNFLTKKIPKRIYGLSILVAMIQVLCKKNMNLA